MTLEEQTSKSIAERRKKDQERINFLEKQIADYEAFHYNNKHDLPDKNLDSIIEILEKELGTSVEPRVTTKSHEYVSISKKKFTGNQRQEYQHYECHKGKNQTMYRTVQELIPTKIVLDNIVNKTNTNNPDLFKVDNLDRKKAFLNMETHKWVTSPQPDTYSNTAPVKESLYSPLRGGLFNATHPFLARNLPVFNIEQFREEKRNKMFKLASHKL